MQEDGDAGAFEVGQPAQGIGHIAAPRLDVAQHVGGEIDAVHAHQGRGVGLDLAPGQGHVLGPVDGVAVDDHAEMAAIGGIERRLQHSLHLAFGAPAIGDEVGDGAYLQTMQLGEADEVGQPRHGAVIVHDLADDPGGAEAGQA